MIRKYYPEAVPGEEFTNQTLSGFQKEYGLNPARTLMATSVCSDEIVRSSTRFSNSLDRSDPFQLGGLAGYPFTGRTGLLAFASHIPDDGAALILYGPHIGFSSDGSVGMMRRKGQKALSSCCGALKASLPSLDVQFEGERPDPEIDYQFRKIVDTLQNEVTEEGNPDLVEVTERMYHLIDREIGRLVDSAGEALSDIDIFLVGGIVINTDHGQPDWFAPRRVEAVER